MGHALDRAKDALFLERLHAKSLAGGLEWTRAEHDGRYQVRVADFVVEIGDGDAGAPEILICDGAGKAIEILTPGLLGEPGEAGAASRREMFLETHEAARRIALGVEDVLERLLKGLT